MNELMKERMSGSERVKGDFLNKLVSCLKLYAIK